MNRVLIKPELERIPALFHRLLQDAAVYDSSCSSEARVLYIEQEGGFYLKSAPAGSLEREAALTRYFHTMGLATQVLEYHCGERD